MNHAERALYKESWPCQRNRWHSYWAMGALHEKAGTWNYMKRLSMGTLSSYRLDSQTWSVFRQQRLSPNWCPLFCLEVKATAGVVQTEGLMAIGLKAHCFGCLRGLRTPMCEPRQAENVTSWPMQLATNVMAMHARALPALRQACLCDCYLGFGVCGKPFSGRWCLGDT